MHSIDIITITKSSSSSESSESSHDIVRQMMERYDTHDDKEHQQHYLEQSIDDDVDAGRGWIVLSANLCVHGDAERDG